MISDDILSPIGHTIKPHGINGEINAVIEADVDLDQLSCLIMKIDGINVPFFIESWRSRGSDAVLLKFDHVADEQEAMRYCGLELLAQEAELPENDGEAEDGFFASDLIGWSISDRGTPLGRIEDFDDSTENLLLSVVTDDNRRLFVPLADELVLAIDADRRILDMDLPSGLNEL